MTDTEERKRFKARFGEFFDNSDRIAQLEQELNAARLRETELRNDILQFLRAGSIDLTQRERQVLAGIQAGKQNKQIANDLFISERTVKFHVSAILTKLKKTSRHDL